MVFERYLREQFRCEVRLVVCLSCVWRMQYFNFESFCIGLFGRFDDEFLWFFGVFDKFKLVVYNGFLIVDE